MNDAKAACESKISQAAFLRLPPSLAERLI